MAGNLIAGAQTRHTHAHARTHARTHTHTHARAHTLTHRRSIANLSPGHKPLSYLQSGNSTSYLRTGHSWPGELSEDFDEDQVDTDVYCQVCMQEGLFCSVSRSLL